MIQGLPSGRDVEIRETTEMEIGSCRNPQGRMPDPYFTSPFKFAKFLKLLNVKKSKCKYSIYAALNL